MLRRLTIAIPTFNRAELVEIAVRNLMAQANTGPRWRVLVIDNRSTDDTAARLERLQREWTRLEVLNERRQGLSFARNRALDACDGGWLLFADDECKFPPDYVDRALAIIDTKAPAMFGGPVRPWYPTQPPHWYRDEYGSFSLPWLAPRASRIYLSGGNIGFSVDALRSVGGFDPALGMSGGRIAFGEETDVEERILRRFGPDSVFYDPDFYNLHAVRPEKFRWRYLIRENFQRGVSRATVFKAAAAGTEASRDVAVPACLRPEAGALLSGTPRVWQCFVYEKGLPLLRVVGQLWGRSRNAIFGNREGR